MRMPAYIIDSPTVLRHGVEFPLLVGDDAFLTKGKSYPRAVSFEHGDSQALFIGGVVSTAEINTICAGIAEEIASRFSKQKILLIQVLEGSRPFSDQVILCLQSNFPAQSYEVAALKVCSYTHGSQANGHKIILPLHNAKGEIHNLADFDTVVVLDDLLDMGNTIHWLTTKYLAKLNAPAIKAFFMLEKERMRTSAVNRTLAQSEALCGCLVPDKWVVGFGLDINLPGTTGQAPLHLFRSGLPGGIYAFNDNIEQKLIKEYQNSPDDLMKQLRVYIGAI